MILCECILLCKCDDEKKSGSDKNLVYEIPEQQNIIIPDIENSKIFGNNQILECKSTGLKKDSIGNELDLSN